MSLKPIVLHLNKFVSRRLAAPAFDAHLALTAFYLIFMGAVAKDWGRLLSTGTVATDWYGILKIFFFLPPQIISFNFAYMGMVVFFVAAGFFPRFKTLRVLAFVSLILLFNVIFTSTGKINHHSFHIGFFISFALIFFDQNKPLKNKIVLLACQYTMLAHYTMSGIWKVLGTFRSLLHDNTVPFDQVFLYHLAYSLAEGNSATPLANFVLENPWLSGPIWLTVIVVELFAFLALFSEFAFRHWWKLIFLLHLGAGVTMGIWFTAANDMFVYLFIIVPYLAYRNSQTDELCEK